MNPGRTKVNSPKFANYWQQIPATILKHVVLKILTTLRQKK